jgi:hypothetical protein
VKVEQASPYQDAVNNRPEYTWRARLGRVYSSCCPNLSTLAFVSRQQSEHVHATPLVLFDSSPMDLFVVYPQYQVLVCKPCGFAVAPRHLAGHIKNRHARDACRDAGLDSVRARSRIPAVTLARRLLQKYDLLDPQTHKIPLPSPTEPPLPDLKLHCGYQCTRCEYVLLKSKSGFRLMDRHFNQHRQLLRKPGRPKKIANIPEEDKGPIFKEVYCQRFFVSGHQSCFFVVHVLSKIQELKAKPYTSKANLLRAILAEQLHASQLEQQIVAQTYKSAMATTEVSPWLEMTRWPRYFNGLDMTKVAPLAYAPNPITEAALVALGESFDRVIEQAYQSICEDRISVFDQAKINSFIADRSAKQERMIMVKLQKGTFRAYKDLWKRLLCFVYRTSLPTQEILLAHQVTTEQLARLDQTMVLADELLSLRNVEGYSKAYQDEAQEITRDMDNACLLLCISLLEHTLRGDHFESVILSFLAVLGIDEKPGGVFRSTLNYSSDLSKFIKMAQMLVVQRAVTGAENGEVEHPSDLLDEMRQRFMVRGTRTAFDWAYRLRSYAKKVVSNTTSLGYIMWSEDAGTVTYRDTTFSMDSFRNFVVSQVERAQKDLEDLLLLHPEED